MTPAKEQEMTAVTSLIADRVKNLVVAHYEEIRDLASDEGNEGVVKIAMSVELDYSGKTPAGAVNISFSRKTKDGAVFSVEPHPELPLA